MDFPTTYGPGFVESLGSGTVVANVAAHTKGAYVDVVASTSMDYDGLLIQATGGTIPLNFLVDIAVGPAASEQIILADFHLSNITRLNQWIHIPMSIPSGSRISARGQCPTGSTQTVVTAHGVRNGFLGVPPGGSISTLGAVTATTLGTAIDPGAAANTYGAWVPLAASVSSDIVAIMPVLGSKRNTAPQDTFGSAFSLQIGVGAAASEQVVWGPLSFGSNAIGLYGPLPFMWLPASIPAGSRVAARAKCSHTDATDRLFDLVIYALTI